MDEGVVACGGVGGEIVPLLAVEDWPKTGLQGLQCFARGLSA